MDKDVLFRALKKSYIIICCFNNKGEEYIHASLNRKIIEYVIKKPWVKQEFISTNTLHTVYDIKNETFFNLDTSKISQFEIPGLPYEVGPHYIVNPGFEGKVLADEVFEFQKPELDKLIEIKSYQTNNNVENNFIPFNLLHNLKLLNAAAFYKTRFLEDHNNVIKNDALTKDICSGYLPEIKFLDKAYIQKLFESDINKNDAVINLNYLKQIEKLNSILSKNNLEFPRLDEENNLSLEEYKKLWKNLIQDTCNKLIVELTSDNDKFKNEFPELATDQEEVAFVIKTLKDTSNDIDFTKFKTPRELFSFWPPILYPAPEYVIDSVFLK